MLYILLVRRQLSIRETPGCAVDQIISAHFRNQPLESTLAYQQYEPASVRGQLPLIFLVLVSHICWRYKPASKSDYLCLRASKVSKGWHLLHRSLSDSSPSYAVYLCCTFPYQHHSPNLVKKQRVLSWALELCVPLISFGVISRQPHFILKA